MIIHQTTTLEHQLQVFVNKQQTIYQNKHEQNAHTQETHKKETVETQIAADLIQL